MTAVGLSMDEKFPVFMMDRAHPDVTVEVDSLRLDRWRMVSEEYAEIQKEMEEAYDAARAAIPD